MEGNTCMKALLRSFSTLLLVLAAAVALWQSYRARRSVKEMHPPREVPLPEAVPHISIILPVRNEEENINACVSSLLAQDYPDFDLTIIDDGSTDATPCLLAKWEEQDSRVHVHRIEHLPSGWAGKTHALHTGVTRTKSDWLLFTDADTWHAPHTLSLMAGHAIQQRDDLLSVHTNVVTISGSAMPLIMPITEILLAWRVTPREMSDPTSPRSFAFGQYMLLRSAAYLATGGYAAADLRGTSVDDLALAEQFKHCGCRIEVVTGRGLIKNRQWATWQSARQGWRKSYYGVIVRSRLPLAGLPFPLAFIAYGTGPLAVLLGALRTRKVRRPSVLLAGITVLSQIHARRSFDRVYDLDPVWSLTAPAGWLVCGVLAFDTTRLHLTGRAVNWKGRQIPRQVAPSYHLHRRRQSPEARVPTKRARAALLAMIRLTRAAAQLQKGHARALLRPAAIVRNWRSRSGGVEDHNAL
jgi:chlorobactene glucosyltransferase